MGAPTNGGARNGGSLPAWAHAIATIGIPGAIALFLVYVGSQTLPTLRRELVAIRISYEKIAQGQEDVIAREGEILRRLQRVCVNLAHDDQERAKCLD